jgi:hypothetical protein
VKREHKKLFKGIETGQTHGKWKVAYRAIDNEVPCVWLIEKDKDGFPEVMFHNTVEQTLADGKTLYNCVKMTVEEFLKEAKGGQGTTKG